MSHSTIALSLFILAYTLFVFLPRHRTLVASAAALLLMATGVLGPLDALKAINWNVMGIFVGTLMVADVFIESRFPAYFAEVIVNRARNTAWALLFICIMTGVVSAFVENVATVLIVAPIALSLARKLKIDAREMMIAIAICSNLQGAATLIGDPPSMLLGGYAKMTFMDFFFYQGKPSIFFAVELGAICSFGVLYLVFHKHHEKPEIMQVETVRSWLPTILLVVLIAALAVTSLYDKDFSYLAGGLCMVFGVVMLLGQTGLRRREAFQTLRKLDWDTTFFLMAIFIIVSSLTDTGWIDAISHLLSGLISENVLLGFVVIVVFSMLFSAFVDNVPFLAAMLPVAQKMAGEIGIEPSLFLFALLIGASLGGNITPIGASANIVACGLAKQEGYPITFRQFARISVPFTLAAVIPAAVFVWFVWGP